MIELKVTVDAPELSAAINHLAEAIESKGTDAPAAPAKNSRSKKAAAKTAPDAPAASAPAPSEPVAAPASIEQPAVTSQPVQTPVITPAQQPTPAAPMAAPVMPQPVATATPVMTPPAAPVTQQFIPQPAATPTPAPVAPAQPQQSSVTLEQIINAAMPLMNSNPAFAMQLQGILAKYGVQAVTQIPKEYLPNVAADLAALGAKF
nr:MAG TPA: hypothetical protein [Caudoviricetes sp.]